MQTLTYQNLRGETAVFALEPYVLGTVRGLGMCDVDMTKAKGSIQHGQTVMALRREARVVEATIHIMAHSKAELYRRRMALAAILSMDKAWSADGGRGKLIYENDFGRWWTWAVPEGGTDWTSRVANVHPKLKVCFTCESSFWYGIAPREVAFKARRVGFTLPVKLPPLVLGSNVFSIPAVNDGYAYAPVTITIDGDGELPCLRNDAVGAVIRLVKPLPKGDRLTIRTDPARLRVSVTHADGTEENAYGMLDPTTSIAGFQLRPGENVLVYEPGADTARSVIRVTWYDCYEGV